MTNAKTNNIYSWRTKKTATGFESIVRILTPSDVELKDGTYCDAKTIEKYRITHTSRAIAKRYAQKCCRYLKLIAA